MPLAAHASRTFVMSPAPGRIPVVRMATGEIETFAFDLSELPAGSDSVNGTPSWAASSNVVAATSESLVGGVTANVQVTAGSSEGNALLTCTVTMTSSRVYKRSVAVQVRTPL